MPRRSALTMPGSYGEAPGAVLVPVRAVAGDVAPFRVVERSERRARDAQVALDLRQILELRVQPGVHVLQPHQARPRHERADVVHHQAADRRAGFGRHHHPDQSAHRRADPVDPVRPAAVPQHACEVVRRPAGMREHMREQRRRIRLIEGEAVVGLVGEPLARPASRDVDADDAAVGGEACGEIVEVAAVAREPMHADHDVRVVRAAPLGVRHAVETARTEAGELPEAGMGHWEARRRASAERPGIVAARHDGGKCDECGIIPGCPAGHLSTRSGGGSFPRACP